MARSGKSTTYSTYIVQPFRWGRGGLVPADARRLDSEPQALRRAADLQARFPGVAVLEMEVDEAVDYCGEPRVIASYGEVPEVG